MAKTPDKNQQFEIVKKKYQNICLYCKEEIAVICGTPLIYLSGCCYGQKVGKTMYIFGRKIHLHCWLNKKHWKIIDNPQKKLEVKE